MKLNETQLNARLVAQAVDGEVHVIHDPEHNYTSSYIITGVDPDNVRVAVRAAIARRNPRDNFCRRIGRLISKGRLNAGNHLAIDLQMDVPEDAESWRQFDAAVVRALDTVAT